MAADSTPDHGAGSSTTDGEEEQGPPAKVPKIEVEAPKQGDNRRGIRGPTSAPRRHAPAPRRTPLKAGETGNVAGAQGQLRQPYSVVQIARASNAPPFTVFECEICDKICKTSAALGSHKRVHDRDGN